MKTANKLILGAVAAVALIAGTASSVNIHGNVINADTGYQIAAGAGTSGQALCSNGTVFNTPCNVAAPVFTGTSGYQLLPSGLILQWGTTGAVSNDTATSISLPFTFPHACLNVQATDAFLGGVSANWSSYSCGTTSFTIRPDGNTAGAHWTAIGY